MKKKVFKPVTYLLILSMGTMLTFTSCGADPEPMELPPAESLVVDLDQFPSSSKKASELTIENWLYSSLSVLGWNVVLVANVAIPVAAYTEILKQTPVYLGDNSWEWTTSVVVGMDTYTAILIGTRLDNETYSMEMSLSKVGGFQNFVWFEGVIRYDHTVVDWTVSHSPENPTTYLNIHFEKDWEKGEGSIRYTVVDSNNDLYNSYIEYGTQPEMDYDAFYTIFKNDTAINIEWNMTNNSGRVMSPVYFEDELWHCWDETLQDVDCNVQ